MKQDFSVAIIGISGYGRVILRSFQSEAKAANARLVAAVVINRQEEAEACRELEAQGCTIYTDYETMLRDWAGRLDLCFIPTSIHWHARMTQAVLAAGANVEVEKPLAGSPEEGQEMIEAGRAAGKFIAVGFQDMYMPAIWESKERLLAGELGPIASIEVTGSWPRTRDYYTRNNWAGRLTCQGRPVYDSPLNNAFAHFVNLSLFFAGDKLDRMASIQRVQGQLLRFYPIESFDTAFLTLTTREASIPIRIALTHADAVQRSPEIIVHLRDGQLSWRHEEAIILRHRSGEILRRWELPVEDAKQRDMMRNVLGSLTGKQAPRCPATLALRHAEVIRQIHDGLPIREGAKAFAALEASRAGEWDFVPGLFEEMTHGQHEGAMQIVAA